jgi:hypothetical protein
MLPVQKPTHTYRTLEEIRQRKEELAEQISSDSTRFSTLWHDAFTSKENATKGEHIASLISKGFVAFDAFLMVRKLMKTYGFLTSFSKKKKRK